MRIDGTVENLLRRDRLIVLGTLCAVIAASWAYLLAGAGMGMSAVEMTRMSLMAEPMLAGAAAETMPWTPGYAVVMFLMWWVMMIAMMLPGATPMILLFAAVNRGRRKHGNPHVPTTLFAATYLLAWAGFSLAATVVHWLLSEAGMLAPGMVLSTPDQGAVLMIAAGLYQLTPIKQACVKHCRLPAAYLASHWRPGTRGALIMGLQHGVYCLGCCWFLMLLLFYGGVMNLYWITALAAYVLLEKAIPAGHRLDRGLAAVLIVSGIWLIAG